MHLYSFFASSTAYRVRIALALKHLPVELEPVDLFALAQREATYMDKNPAASVPFLEDGELRLGQSLAIIDYLDARYPEPRLVPGAPRERARVLELSNLIACDIQPLNGLRVLRYLRDSLQLDEASRHRWYAHWIAEGFRALEKLLERAGAQRFCVGDRVSLADCCLVPQVANAVRDGCDLAPYPRTRSIYAHCTALPAFRQAAPEAQPDYRQR